METIGRDLNEMQRVPLAGSHVAAMRREGAVVQNAAGTMLVRPGEPIDRFVYVEEGEIEVVNPGIFAVGDVRAGSVKRLAPSVGEGSVVISKVWEHLNT